MLRPAAKTRYTTSTDCGEKAHVHPVRARALVFSNPARLHPDDLDGKGAPNRAPARRGASPRHRVARAEMAAEGDAGGELFQQPVRDSGPVLRRDHSRADDAAGRFVVRVPVLAVRDPALRPRLHPHHLEPGATPWPRLRRRRACADGTVARARAPSLSALME